MSGRKYYLTSQIHDAGSRLTVDSIYGAVLADAIARHKRMCGFDVAHLIAIHAHEARIESSGNWARNTQPLASQDDKTYQKNLVTLGVGATHFISTASPEHAKAVEMLLLRTLRRSRRAIYLRAYEGRYCPYDGIDVAESTEPALCPRCGRAAELISGERHFFRLGAFRDRLLALYKYRPEFIQPRSVSGQVERLILNGLPDLPLSVPAVYGGGPWPGDPRYAVSDLYSNLTAYVSGIGFGQDGYASDEFRREWPANLHIAGMSELALHAIYWPAFLMAADLAPPRHVFVHATVRSDGENPAAELVGEAAGGGFASDAVRFFLLRTVCYADDTRIDTRSVATRYTTDIALGLESLTESVLSLAKQYCDGKVPCRSIHLDKEPSIETLVADLRAEVRILLDAFDFRQALVKIWSLIHLIQTRIAELPREQDLDRDGKSRARDLVHDACEGLGWIVLLLHPILPRITDAIWKGLGQTTRLEDQLIDETPWCCLKPGTPLADFVGIPARPFSP